jgi:hypothetical protein
VLPAGERDEPAPEWPLGEQSDAETAMWARYWRKPQARYWLDHAMVEVVALFVRQFCESSSPKNSAENRKATQSFLSVLGLTAPSLKAAGYVIDVEPVEQRQAPQRESRATTKTDLKVIDGGKGA